MDVLNNPFVVAVLALLALPGVTSTLAGVLKKLTDKWGINARVPVYLAALALTGVIVFTGGAGAVPAFSGDPATVVGAWLAWATVTAELARRLYELLWERVPVA